MFFIQFTTNPRTFETLPHIRLIHIFSERKRINFQKFTILELLKPYLKHISVYFWAVGNSYIFIDIYRIVFTFPFRSSCQHYNIIVLHTELPTTLCILYLFLPVSIIFLTIKDVFLHILVIVSFYPTQSILSLTGTLIGKNDILVFFFSSLFPIVFWSRKVFFNYIIVYYSLFLVSNTSINLNKYLFIIIYELINFNL